MKKPKKPKNPKHNPNPNAPVVLENRYARFVIYKERLKNFPLKKITVTLLLVLVGGIGSAWFQAQNSNTQVAINAASRQLRSIQAENATLRASLQERYTPAEIERIAQERLGMSAPDPAQVVNIYVPRLGGVTLNNDEDVLPQHNYFWSDVTRHLSESMNRLFGGS
ncbi:MAG: cell division protein FtsL [Defluviitaleaceae bacterium]|nr:cell division protein FtsL [Defluviitaleaceae bacterium]